MSQYQAPQGDAQGFGQQPGYGQQPAPADGGYGQASVPLPPQPDGGYGQASMPQGAGEYGQPSAPLQPQQPGAYGHASAPQQPGGYGQPQPGGYTYGGQYPTSSNVGLFDTTFAVSSTQRTAKLAYVAIIVFAGVLALAGLFEAIAHFSNVTYGGAAVVLSGLASLLVYGALAFGVLTVGRIVIDFFVQEDKKRQAG